MFIAPSQGQGHIIEMMRTHEAHYDINKKQGPLNNEQEENFSTMVFRAMQGVNQDQKTSMDLYQQMILDPDSVDVHDVSIAAAKAQMSLSLAKNVIDKAVKAYQDIISIR